MHSVRNFETNFKTNFARHRSLVATIEQGVYIKVCAMALNTSAFQFRLNFT